MSFAKDRKVLIWSLVLLGLPLMVLGAVHHEKQLAEWGPGAQLPGPKPGMMMMTLAVNVAFRKHAEDPNSLEGLAFLEPTVDQEGDLACWRYPFNYWARNRFGMMSMHRGTFWVKDGHVIREQWD
jgi:hypothetical protein